MKKVIVLVILLLCIASYSFAEGSWLCPSCGEEVTGNFCSNCGQSNSEDNSVEGIWVNYQYSMKEDDDPISVGLIVPEEIGEQLMYDIKDIVFSEENHTRCKKLVSCDYSEGDADYIDFFIEHFIDEASDLIIVFPDDSWDQEESVKKAKKTGTVLMVVKTYDTAKIAEKINGILGKQTKEELNTPTQEESDDTVIIAQKGDKNELVRGIQEKLIGLGYLNGKADGDFGNKTKTAVEAFQKDYGLEVTGTVTSVEMSILEENSPNDSIVEERKTNKNNETYDLAYVIKGNNYWIYWVINTSTKAVRSFTTNSHYVSVGTYTGDLINGADIQYKDGATEHICYKWAMNDSKLIIDGYYEATKTSVEFAMDYLNRPEYQDTTE